MSGVIDDGLRPEIAKGWHRAALSGLDPGMKVRETSVSDFDERSRLATAAGPVLDKMIEELANTRFSVLLADRSARIIDRRLGSKGLDKALDRVMAVPGTQYLEEFSGTNSLATAYELRQPISVTGEEHFLEELRVFCCYGAPIIHPITRRLEGVLDVSGPVRDSTNLLGPFLMRGVRDIEQRLLDGTRQSERILFAEFQVHANTKKRAILVLGQNLVLSNTAAIDLVTNDDHATLRSIAATMSGGSSFERSLTLSSGSHVVVKARTVENTSDGVLFDIEVPPSGVPPVPVIHIIPASSRPGALSLIVGEPGTGRTTAARREAGPDALLFDALHIDDSSPTALPDALSALESMSPVIVDNVHLLPPRPAAILRAAIRASNCRVVMTSSPTEDLGPEQSALCAEAIVRCELPPVRRYGDQFAPLTRDILASLGLGSSLTITPSTLRILSEQSWPGNIGELRAVLDHAVRGRTVGSITESDLPANYSVPATHNLTIVEVAERDTILSVLDAVNGNKTAAAATLGLGRTTLYERLRRYRITL